MFFQAEDGIRDLVRSRGLGDVYKRQIRTNLNSQNFKLVKTPVNKTEVENWEEVIQHREDVFLEDFELFKNYLVVSERKEGCLLYTSPSPRDRTRSRMPSSA